MPGVPLDALDNLKAKLKAAFQKRGEKKKKQGDGTTETGTAVAATTAAEVGGTETAPAAETAAAPAATETPAVPTNADPPYVGQLIELAGDAPVALARQNNPGHDGVVVEGKEHAAPKDT